MSDPDPKSQRVVTESRERSHPRLKPLHKRRSKPHVHYAADTVRGDDLAHARERAGDVITADAGRALGPRESAGRLAVV